ncbi:trypsin zeta-like [Teleopsis dalmanni]|uniref:trypsin zeta-like n=1 Tax=Teleopsis dalmanni TaxID=139649 RepID=UPI0018CE91E1|nr:trypsin zeta-like [Teleopsis dalmanni]
MTPNQKSNAFNAISGSDSINRNDTSLKKIEQKIIGSVKIPITEAPFQASIRLKIYEKLGGFGYGHLCSGSVLSQRVIITAAQCSVDLSVSPPKKRLPKEYTIVLGGNSLYVKDNYTLQYNLIQIVPHGAFNLTSLSNDIALMLINGYIPWTWPTVRSVILNSQLLTENTTCTITGWATTEYGQVSDTLLTASVPIVGNDVCAKSYGNLSQSSLCAGNMSTGGVDTCQGDSGGPLMCNGVLAGIVSWGNQCGLKQYPGVYTNVLYYKNWIEYANRTLDYNYYSTGTIKSLSNFLLLNFLLLMACV